MVWRFFYFRLTPSVLSRSGTVAFEDAPAAWTVTPRAVFLKRNLDNRLHDAPVPAEGWNEQNGPR